MSHPQESDESLIPLSQIPEANHVSMQTIVRFISLQATGAMPYQEKSDQLCQNIKLGAIHDDAPQTGLLKAEMLLDQPEWRHNFEPMWALAASIQSYSLSSAISDGARRLRGQVASQN